MTKKKSPNKKTTTRKNSSKISFINKLLIFILISLIATIASYFIILKNHNEKNEIQPVKKEQTISKIKDNIQEEFLIKKEEEPIVDKYEEYTKDLEKDYMHEKEDTNSILKTKIEDNLKPIKEIVKKIINDEQKIEIKEEKAKDIIQKPKLSIVIDDVTLKSQVRKIEEIGYRVNIAFMPPTKQHKNSAKIAQDLPFAIVHFPLQATITRFEEENTLKVGDSYEKIEKRVAAVRRLYPNVEYTNNHTGSVFTSDEKSMDMFIKALKKHNFKFIDSRTTSNSLAKKYTQKYGMPYIARNIFLDNNKDFDYIQNQLKKAINIAHKTGSAIAIGHPYPITMEVLKKSKHLLKDLDLVYINQLPIN